MAKYTITRACGHEEVVELYGPTKSRELRIKYLEQELCSECLDEQRAEQAKEDREKSLAEGYPELLGSPRQIQWAEQIRREFIDWIDSLEFVDDADPDGLKAVGIVSEQIGREEKATFFIDHRDDMQIWFANEVNKIAEKLKKGVHEKKGIVLEPESGAAHPGTVTVEESQGSVTVRYIKNDQYVRVMHWLEYSWIRPYWVNYQHKGFESTFDTVASTVNELLKKGFKVRCPYEVGLAVKNGEFKPFNPRHIEASNSAFYLAMENNADLVDMAKKLPSAKYQLSYDDKVRYKVPDSFAAEVEEFAEVYGFCVSTSAKEKMMEAKTEEFESVVPIDAPDLIQASAINLRQEGVIEDLLDD